MLRPGEELWRIEGLFQDRSIQLTEHIHCFSVLGPHHNSVRIEEVIEGLPLAEELWIGSNETLAVVPWSRNTRRMTLATRRLVPMGTVDLTTTV